MSTNKTNIARNTATTLAQRFFVTTKAAVAIEFVLVMNLVLSMVFFSNEAFRMNIIDSRTKRVATNLAQIVSQQTGSDVTFAQMSNFIDNVSVVMQPFIDTFEINPCGVNSADVDQTHPFRCGVIYAKFDNTCSSNWRQHWTFNGTGNRFQCTSSCMNDVTVAAVTGTKTLIDIDELVGGITSGPAHIVFAFAYVYHATPAAFLPTTVTNQLTRYRGASFSSVGGTTGGSSIAEIRVASADCI